MSSVGAFSLVFSSVCAWLLFPVRCAALRQVADSNQLSKELEPSSVLLLPLSRLVRLPSLPLLRPLLQRCLHGTSSFTMVTMAKGNG